MAEDREIIGEIQEPVAEYSLAEVSADIAAAVSEKLLEKEESGKYVPKDPEEQRRSFVVEMFTQIYCQENIPDHNMVRRMNAVSEWLAKGVLPPEPESVRPKATILELIQHENRPRE